MNLSTLFSQRSIVMAVCFVACCACCISCAKHTPTRTITEAGDSGDVQKISVSEGSLDQLKFNDIQSEEHAPFANEATKAIVVIFIATDCPIANYFQPAISEMAANAASDGVPFFLVHSDPDLGAEAAAKHAEEFKVSSPVIMDSDQSIAKMLAAKVTPEAFVIDREGVVRYRGRINDLYVELGKRRPQPTTHNLRDAIEAVVHGKEIAMPKTRAIGCYIPFPKTEAANTELPE